MLCELAWFRSIRWPGDEEHEARSAGVARSAPRRLLQEGGGGGGSASQGLFRLPWSWTQRTFEVGEGRGWGWGGGKIQELALALCHCDTLCLAL